MSDEPITEPTEPTADPPVPPTVKGDEDPPKAKTVPIARLDAESAKTKKLREQVAEFEKKEKAEADSKAQAEGDVKAAQTERDAAKAELAGWTADAESDLEARIGNLTEEDAKFMKSREDLPLRERLSLVKHLESRSPEEKKEPAVGSKGGPGEPSKGTDDGGLPKSITTRGEYHAWLQEEQESMDPERMARITNPKSMAKIREAAKARQLT